MTQQTLSLGPEGDRYYNVRDELGHWVAPVGERDDPCEHACCRGYRSHPQDTGIIRSNAKLRKARERDLVAAFNETSQGDSEADRQATARILHELERRDRAATELREAKGRGRAARAYDREAYTEHVYVQGEAYTRGNWVNRAGDRAGISDREILTGPQPVFDRYASDEAREYFLTHDRPTAGFFRKQTAEQVGGGASWWR